MSGKAGRFDPQTAAAVLMCATLLLSWVALQVRPLHFPWIAFIAIVGLLAWRRFGLTLEYVRENDTRGRADLVLAIEAGFILFLAALSILAVVVAANGFLDFRASRAQPAWIERLVKTKYLKNGTFDHWGYTVEYRLLDGRGEKSDVYTLESSAEQLERLPVRDAYARVHPGLFGMSWVDQLDASPVAHSTLPESKAGPASSDSGAPAAIDLRAFRTFRPSAMDSAEIFDQALAKLDAKDDDAFREIGRLAFNLETIPALTYIIENGSEKQSRLGFSGLRALMIGIASVGFEQQLPAGTKLEVFRLRAIPVLARPENLRRIKAGFEKLPAPGKATFEATVNAIQ